MCLVSFGASLPAVNPGYGTSHILSHFVRIRRDTRALARPLRLCGPAPLTPEASGGPTQQLLPQRDDGKPDDYRDEGKRHNP